MFYLIRLCWNSLEVFTVVLLETGLIQIRQVRNQTTPIGTKRICLSFFERRQTDTKIALDRNHPKYYGMSVPVAALP